MFWNDKSWPLLIIAFDISFMSWNKFTELNKSDASLLRAFRAPRFLGQQAMNELNGYFGSRTRHRSTEDGAEISDDLSQCSK